MEITIKELLENGVYFGHPTKHFDPRIRPYLYGKRQGIYIIDIEKTVEKAHEAFAFLKTIASQKKLILFVGTKKQAHAAVQEIAELCGSPYVNYRWIGGTLTNFSTIRKRIARLEEIETMEETGRLSVFTKKEGIVILREKEKLIKKFGGIRTLTEFPAAIIVVDVRREHNTIAEAKKIGIPVVGIVDTNGNPQSVDYPVPANDDGLKSIRLILSKLGEGIQEGRMAADYLPVPPQMIEQAVREQQAQKEKAKEQA